MKKKIVLIAALVLMMIFAAGCTSTKLAKGYDREELKKTGEQVINEVALSGAKEVLQKRMREEFIGKIDLDTMNNTVVNLCSGKGEFLVYSQETVIGRPYKGEDMAVVLISATYEKGEIVYTLTFDKDLNLVGFYAK